MSMLDHQSVLIVAGSLTGKHIFPESMKKKFPYLPGTLLVIIGALRLIK